MNQPLPVSLQENEVFAGSAYFPSMGGGHVSSTPEKM